MNKKKNVKFINLNAKKISNLKLIIKIFFQFFYLKIIYLAVMSSARQSVPSNDSELQLFRVLERANLLLYYESFIQNGKFIFYEFRFSHLNIPDIYN